MAKEELEGYDEEDTTRELTDEEKELLEIEKGQSTKVSKGQAEFRTVDHSKRAVKFARVSEGDTTKYVNVALEYFGHRCALSGEKFEVFDKKVNGKKTNLSAEHIVALCLGGDDIVPNIVPTVLQYNLRKNGYYILDYWNKQKDTDGKNLYSPYRLLKLVNYMMKSIDARKQGIKDVKKYRKVILTPNEIDEFLAEIEKQDEQEPDNTKKKLHSDTITATTIDEDNKKILTQVPEVEGNIPTQREQQEMTRDNEIEMMDIFLTDAVSLLKREKELQQIKLRDKDGNVITLQQKLDQMLETAIGVIPFEVKVRNTILEKLESLGIRENKYSVANDLLKNTEILGLARDNQEDVNKIVENYIEKQLEKIREEQILREEQIKTIISNMPSVLYDEKEMNKIRLWSAYRKDSFQELISGKYTATDNFIDAIIILKKNGINLVYRDEQEKTKNTILQHGFTIEKMLENYRPRLTKEQKEKIKLELKEMGVNDNIGISLNTQKEKDNVEKFTEEFKKLREQLKKGGIELRQDEINSFIKKREKSQDPTRDMIKTIEILKKNGVDLVYRDKKRKIKNTIRGVDTVETMLENYIPKLTNEQKEKIRLELNAANINQNIGKSLDNQKNKANAGNFTRQVERLIEQLKQDNIKFSHEEIRSLIEKQRSGNPTHDMIKAIEILKKNGINLVYRDEQEKTKNTIKYIDTVETMLENYRPKLTKEHIEEIRLELRKVGINEKKRIGLSLTKQKGIANIEKFAEEVKKLREQLKQEGIELSQEEIDSLIPSRQTTAQDIGKASYDAPTAGCDEKQDFMKSLERTIEERGKAG